jgi:hypothetical protein
MTPTRWAAVALVALAAPVCAQQPAPAKESPAPASGRSLRADRGVRLAVRGGAIQVKPMFALVALGDPLEWQVEDLPAGSELEIDFVSAENKVGPFPWRTSAQNPKRGRYVLGPHQKHTTQKAEAVGYWKYQVIVRLPDGNELSIDPGVIIKEGG